MNQFTLEVIDVRKETNDSVTLVFKKPRIKKIVYKSGQYITLILNINNRKYYRPYSISSAPNVDSSIDITIKRVLGGVVSNHICDFAKEGDVFEVLKPTGDFIIDEDACNYTEFNVILWGAGSGITPLYSIAKYLLNHSLKHHVTLVYGNRNNSSVIFKDQIEALEIKHTGNLSVWHFYTELFVSTDNPYIVQGRIKPMQVLSVLSNELDIKNTLHYICGPTGLKESVKAALETYGILESQVFSEDFELIKNEKDFIDVFTQIVSIKKNGENKEVEVVKGKSILEAGLDALIEMPYSCQTGNCSICKGKLIRGAVKQIIKKHPDLGIDEYQLCCTYPLSNDVVVEL